ncbi:hypothetical protein DFP73DRAFT_551615 [Morchella snyderi]|nr:hypothetical protein DFP73DRAFT_551615 [Morchella snyderi]
MSWVGWPGILFSTVSLLLLRHKHNQSHARTSSVQPNPTTSYSFYLPTRFFFFFSFFTFFLAFMHAGRTTGYVASRLIFFLSQLKSTVDPR